MITAIFQIPRNRLCCYNTVARDKERIGHYGYEI